MFVKLVGDWGNGAQTAKLTAADGAAGDQLGYSVAVSADGATIIAGAPYARIGSNVSQGRPMCLPGQGAAGETAPRLPN